EPEWAGKDPVPSADGVLVPLSSQRFATLQEAEQQVTELASAYIRKFYQDEYAIPGGWTVPVAAIQQHAVNTIVGEEIDKDFGDGIGAKKMYRAHLRLDLNSALRKALRGSWQDHVVT